MQPTSGGQERRAKRGQIINPEAARQDQVLENLVVRSAETHFFFFQAEDGIRDLTLEFRRVLFRSSTAAGVKLKLATVLVLLICPLCHRPKPGRYFLA